MNHNTRKLFRRKNLSIPLPRDVKVLTENTFQIAKGKEDSSRSFPTPQTIFFTKMWKCARYVGITARPAHRGSIFKSIYMTVTGTGLTVSKHIESPFHLLLKNMLVGFVGNQV
jgi:hypothetical protein